MKVLGENDEHRQERPTPISFNEIKDDHFSFRNTL